VTKGGSEAPHGWQTIINNYSMTYEWQIPVIKYMTGALKGQIIYILKK